MWSSSKFSCDPQSMHFLSANQSILRCLTTFTYQSCKAFFWRIGSLYGIPELLQMEPLLPIKPWGEWRISKSRPLGPRPSVLPLNYTRHKWSRRGYSKSHQRLTGPPLLPLELLRQILERPMGLEPISPPYQGGILAVRLQALILYVPTPSLRQNRGTGTAPTTSLRSRGISKRIAMCGHL